MTGRVRGATRVAPQLLDLNRATLARQLLLGRERVPVVDVVWRLVALQAQEPASPYVALWNRMSDFDPAELDAAFRAFSVVKVTLMQITLHAVAADHHAAFHDAMRPTLRAAGPHEERFRATGLTVADADALVPQLLDFAHCPRTRAAIDAMLGRPPRRSAPAGPVAGAVRHCAARPRAGRGALGVRTGGVLRRRAGPRASGRRCPAGRSPARRRCPVRGRGRRAAAVGAALPGGVRSRAAPGLRAVRDAPTDRGPVHLRRVGR